MYLNSAATSKINWTNGIAFIASLVALFGVDISPEMQLSIVASLGVVSQVLTMILRTWFTGKQ